MASTGLRIDIEYRDFDKCRASFQSFYESAVNADMEDCIEIEYQSYAVRWQGMALVRAEHPKQQPSKTAIIMHFKPAPGMILFVGWLMTVLPSRAKATWQDGWPHVYCPPNDDRDYEDDPTPLVPNELIPA